MRPKQCKCPEDILRKAIPLFAQAGFSGVSMRQIARELGISAAALYHHFPDKETLYLAAVDLVFQDKAAWLAQAHRAPVTLEQRLHGVFLQFIQHVGMDHTFRALMQREMLEGNSERLQLMAEKVFHHAFSDMVVLASELSRHYDPNLLAGSIVSLVIHHFQSAPLRPFLPGYQPWHDDDLERLAHYFTQLVLHGVVMPDP
ncbi:MAG: TetR/AcrR family transcriptional regulator [Magnetococcales bacterium]|nr:TetR/AcrR family transcriptional regulator [Magnetococcales bacterium]